MFRSRSTVFSSFVILPRLLFYSFLFFFNDTATTEIYTLSLHDALPISRDPNLTRENRILGELDRVGMNTTENCGSRHGQRNRGHFFVRPTDRDQLVAGRIHNAVADPQGQRLGQNVPRRGMDRADDATTDPDAS